MANENNEQWAIIEIMGHMRTAGRISRPDDWGGLLRVDVPMDNGEYRTEYYGMQAIYSIKLVGKEIASAYAEGPAPAVEYNAPIVTRDQYQAMQERAREEINHANRRIIELERRLTSINALPEPKVDEFGMTIDENFEEHR